MKKGHLISAKEIRNTTLSYMDSAVSEWWNKNLESINKKLTRAAKLGYDSTDLDIPSAYKIPIITKFVEQGYKADCMHDFGNGDSKMVIQW